MLFLPDRALHMLIVFSISVIMPNTLYVGLIAALNPSHLLIVVSESFLNVSSDNPRILSAVFLVSLYQMFSVISRILF